MKKLLKNIPLHSFLVAPYIISFVWNRNMHEVSFSMVWRSLLFSLLISLLLFGISFLFLRSVGVVIDPRAGLLARGVATLRLQAAGGVVALPLAVGRAGQRGGARDHVVRRVAAGSVGDGVVRRAQRASVRRRF